MWTLGDQSPVRDWGLSPNHVNIYHGCRSRFDHGFRQWEPESSLGRRP
jgi:hypothetical protein